MNTELLAERIARARDLDEIMLDLTDAVRKAFRADRATIYAIGDDHASLVSKIRTGADAYTQLKLPISAHSIAGYVALARCPVNLRDVYDEAELRTHAPDLRFQPGVDRRTGYRTREMLAAPLLRDGAVLGVVQLINNLGGGAFSPEIVAGVGSLAEVLASALQRHGGPAQSGARDIEEALTDARGIEPAAIGRALAEYFAVPYVADHAGRAPPTALLAGIDRAAAAAAQWLPLGASRHSVFVVCTDPEQTMASAGPRAAFPHLKPVYCVTTRREFAAMLERFFADAAGQTALPAARRDQLVTMASGMVAALGTSMGSGAAHEVTNLRIDTAPGDREGEIRFTVSGVLRLT